MTRKANLRGIRMSLISAFFLLVFFGCDLLEDSDQLGPQGKARYENPTWLGGSSLDTLRNNPDYEIFIELMDSAGFTKTIDLQLSTLFVPNDDSFNEYFASIGKSGVADLSKEECQQLFSLHMQANPKTKEHLIYENVWMIHDETTEYGALFFRRETQSKAIPYNETVKYNEDYLGEELLIATERKFIPVWTPIFLHTFGGVADGTDYQFMYPNSDWNGEMNWHSAMVTSAEVRTSSGFIYFLDKVVPPMPSMEEYLMNNQDRFGVFYDLIQRFATYSKYKKRESDDAQMYMKSYQGFYDIVHEQGPFVNNWPDNKDCLRHLYTGFIPRNEVMQKYLDETVLKYYDNLDSVPQITLNYIAQSQVAQMLGLISKMETFFTNSFGDKMEMKRDYIDDAYMCSNGLIYETNKVLEPNVFSCVPGRLFFDGNYSTFLQALRSVDLIRSLSLPDTDVTLFAVDNAGMERANYRYNDIDDVIMERLSDGKWSPVQDIELLIEFLKDHIYQGKLEDISGDGYVEMSSGNFVHFANDKIAGGENVAQNENPALVDNGEIEQNGVLYTINDAIETNYSFGQAIMADPDLSDFAELMIRYNYLDPERIDPITEDTIPTISFITSLDYWTGFIPTNEAMKNAYDTVLDTLTSAGDLKNKEFIMYHFVRDEVVVDDGNFSGEVESNLMVQDPIYGNIYLEMEIANSKNNLSVTDRSGQRVTVPHADANKLVRKGVIHKIPSMLDYNKN